MTSKKFNIRVYGIWIHNDKVLVNDELIRGKHVIKFPGGGLDWGEGIIDCLKREWKEELDMDINVLDHLYTTDFFQHSAFDDSQVISIYYFVSGTNPEAAITNQNDGERTYWMDMQQVNEDAFTLPIDKHVGRMLHVMFGAV